MPFDAHGALPRSASDCSNAANVEKRRYAANVTATEIVMSLPERESMEFDVVIVGAGPSGLAAAVV